MKVFGRLVIALIVVGLLFAVSCKQELVYHEVRFNSNGGTVYMVQQVLDGERVLRVVDPVKEGFTFEGWYTDVKCTYKFDFNQPITHGMVIYAKWSGGTPYIPTDCIVFSSDSEFTITVSNPGWDGTIYYYKSGETTDWTEWTKDAAPNGLTSGSDNKLYFRGTGNSKIAVYENPSGKGWTIACSANDVSVAGNIMTLLDYTKDYSKPENLVLNDIPVQTNNKYCFANLFKSCTALKSVSDDFLPATTLAEGCYSQMFNGCTSLTTAPALPATTMKNYCYNGMFAGCTSLTTLTVPDGKDSALPAETLANYCYAYMFDGCESLMVSTDKGTTGVKLFTCTSPSSTDTKVTNMFKGTGGLFAGTPTGTGSGTPYYYGTADNTDYLTFCGTGVTVTPSEYWGDSNKIRQYSIKKGEVQGGWYDWNGTSTISDSNTTAIRFRGKNCTSGSATSEDDYDPWKITGSNVSVSGNIMTLLDYTKDYSLDTNKVIPSAYCFYHMFDGPNDLSDASGLILPATTLDDYCYHGMFYTCTILTSAPALPATTLKPNCYEEMFYGCTALKKAPALPAGKKEGETVVGLLAEQCYCNMFSKCTNLTTAPELPATTLKKGCYFGMFEGCTALKKAPALPAGSLAEQCYYWMFYGCEALKIWDNVAPSSGKYGTIFTAPSSASSYCSDMFKGTFGHFTTPGDWHTYTDIPVVDGHTYYWADTAQPTT